MKRRLPAMLHSDAPSILDGLLLMVLAGLIGYFMIEWRPASYIIGVALAYAVLVTDQLLRNRR